MTRLKPGILYSKSHRCFKWIAFRSQKSSVFFEKQHGLKHHIPLFLFLYLFFEYQTNNSTTLCPPPKKKGIFFKNGRSFFGVPPFLVGVLTPESVNSPDTPAEVSHSQRGAVGRKPFAHPGLTVSITARRILGGGWLLLTIDLDKKIPQVQVARSWKK